MKTETFVQDGVFNTQAYAAHLNKKLIAKGFDAKKVNKLLKECVLKSSKE